MKKDELNEWYKWLKQYENGYHLSENDKRELLRLNHIVMEKVHKIHNENMLGEL